LGSRCPHPSAWTDSCSSIRTGSARGSLLSPGRSRGFRPSPRAQPLGELDDPPKQGDDKGLSAQARVRRSASCHAGARRGGVSRGKGSGSGLAFRSFQRSEIRWRDLRSSYRDRLGELRCPVLLVNGRRTSSCPYALSKLPTSRSPAPNLWSSLTVVIGPCESARTTSATPSYGSSKKDGNPAALHPRARRSRMPASAWYPSRWRCWAPCCATDR
jgi:pimeloyl-ACP methyl ester carboxylesterase